MDPDSRTGVTGKTVTPLTANRLRSAHDQLYIYRTFISWFTARGLRV